MEILDRCRLTQPRIFTEPPSRAYTCHGILSACRRSAEAGRRGRLGTMAGNEDRLARAERHLREGEACVTRLERVLAEMKRANHPETERMAMSVLAPFQRDVATFRERLDSLRD